MNLRIFRLAEPQRGDRGIPRFCCYALSDRERGFRHPMPGASRERSNIMRKFIGVPALMPPLPKRPAAMMGTTIAAVLLRQRMTAAILAALTCLAGAENKAPIATHAQAASRRPSRRLLPDRRLIVISAAAPSPNKVTVPGSGTAAAAVVTRTLALSGAKSLI